MYGDRIETDRLILRPIQMNDTEDIHSYAGDPSIDMMLFFPKETISDTKAFVDYAVAQWNMDIPEDREYVIVHDGTIIGGVSLLNCPEEHTFEIGWTIHNKYRNCGYAAEAANALVKYAFITLKADRVRAHCDSRNIASEKVMRKIGMHLVDNTGTRYYSKTGITSGEYLYAIDKHLFFSTF